MKEESRIALVRNIKKEKRRLHKLKGKAKRIEELKKNPVVIEYLKLTSELKRNLDSADIMHTTSATILKKYATEKSEPNCQDIYLIRRGIGSKHEDGRFFQLDDYEGNYYYYSCIDCKKSFFIDKEESEEFEKGKKVIFAEGMNIHDFLSICAKYFELLMTYHAEEAFSLLKEMIDEKRRGRNR